MNLTGMTSRERIINELFLDSLIPTPDLPKKGKMLDIGSGAGFPSIPIKIFNSSLDAHRVHREILEAITGTRYPASLEVSGESVACALGVLEAGFFGLFDVVTDIPHRNKGHATMLLSSMLGWACANGAAHAYLGVVEANAAARNLYGKLGYQEVYKYWYRIPTL